MLEDALRFAFEKLNKEELITLAIRLTVDGLHAGRKQKTEDPKITINGWNAPELIFSKLEEAEKVYNYMNDLINKYHQVSLGDLYSYLNIDFEFSDFRKGWKELTFMHIARVSKGYKLILPPIKDI